MDARREDRPPSRLPEGASINRTPPATCAICEVPLPPNAALESVLYPFCSKRCKLIDLGRWVDGEYHVTEPLRPEHLDDLPDEDLDALLRRADEG